MLVQCEVGLKPADRSKLIAGFAMTIHKDSVKLTYDDYALIPADGKRHEIIEGKHHVCPVPSLFHQTLSSRIMYQLYTQIELKEIGVVFNAPVDVQLHDHSIVQPDLVVVLSENKEILTKPKIDGVPDLMIEILSPSNPKHDREIKMKLYLKSGIREYWIVDPMNEAIEQYQLQDEAYHLIEHEGVVSLTITDGVTVDTSELWKPV
ncbi:Uma2 family endonuclease [Mariniblastus sp.]|nr:Uma2 family endonuclease [Mariniblastus sp.]